MQEPYTEVYKVLLINIEEDVSKYIKKLCWWIRNSLLVRRLYFKSGSIESLQSQSECQQILFAEIGEVILKLTRKGKRLLEIQAILKVKNKAEELKRIEFKIL